MPRIKKKARKKENKETGSVGEENILAAFVNVKRGEHDGLLESYNPKRNERKRENSDGVDASVSVYMVFARVCVPRCFQLARPSRSEATFMYSSPMFTR